ncbi:BZ3500_MvSof-1268-A1-R1_Chr2-1g04637 [Microbotryum saponariae]|uniref:BZ3500_MvSof-1268-A1-R1_Chr2-1g04637 protein n=1 Tax=Microbotryum saponariae TaxID=289078 RepID=A0A2X0KKB9_9BASI|nr:BZ3500_MvSof-1268-A1-R1_Chr2-1g04637 [Microbotryum saponariae]SCZ92168.1 BZ3501_MvSof-1269-A2-R1_Chr2-1g04293 [Microbotryum saponariae]
MGQFGRLRSAWRCTPAEGIPRLLSSAEAKPPATQPRGQSLKDYTSLCNDYDSKDAKGRTLIRSHVDGNTWFKLKGSAVGPDLTKAGAYGGPLQLEPGVAIHMASDQRPPFCVLRVIVVAQRRVVFERSLRQVWTDLVKMYDKNSVPFVGTKTVRAYWNLRYEPGTSVTTFITEVERLGELCNRQKIAFWLQQLNIDRDELDGIYGTIISALGQERGEALREMILHVDTFAVKTVLTEQLPEKYTFAFREEKNIDVFCEKVRNAYEEDVVMNGADVSPRAEQPASAFSASRQETAQAQAPSCNGNCACGNQNHVFAAMGQSGSQAGPARNSHCSMGNHRSRGATKSCAEHYANAEKWGRIVDGKFVCANNQCLNCFGFGHRKAGCTLKDLAGDRMRYLQSLQMNVPLQGHAFYFVEDPIPMSLADRMDTSYHFTNYVSEVNEQTVFRVTTSKENLELIFDTGATTSLVNDKSLLCDYEELDSPTVMVDATGNRTPAIGRGTLKAEFKLADGTVSNMSIARVLHVPGFVVNLISGPSLCKQGVRIEMEHDRCKFVQNDKTFAIAKLVGSKYIFQARLYTRDPVEAHTLTVSERSNSADREIWHQRFGYLNLPYLLEMDRKGTVMGLNIKGGDFDVAQCAGCMQGRGFHANIPKGPASRADKPLHTIHADIWGPVRHESCTHSRCYARTKVIRALSGSDRVRFECLMDPGLPGSTPVSGLLAVMDFEKAYDRLSHTYLDAVLCAVGLGPKARKWYRATYTNQSASIFLNGWLSAAFDALSGVRQGDPLAPSLFVLAIEGFACQIRLRVKGIASPSLQTIRELLFADDACCALHNLSDLFLHTSHNLDHLNRAIELYERASATKLSNAKSFLYPLGSFRDRPIAPGLGTWRLSDSQFRYLGIQVGVEIAEDAGWEEVKSSTIARIRSIPMYDIPYAAKCSIMNIYCYTKILFYSRFLPAPRSDVQEIEDAAMLAIHGRASDGTQRRPKVSRSRLCTPLDHGGFGLIDLPRRLAIDHAKWVFQLRAPDGCFTRHLFDIRIRLQAANQRTSFTLSRPVPNQHRRPWWDHAVRKTRKLLPQRWIRYFEAWASVTTLNPPELSKSQNLERWVTHVLFFPAGHGIQLSVNPTLFRGPDGEVMTPSSFVNASKRHHAFLYPPILPNRHQKVFSLPEQRWNAWWKALRKVRRFTRTLRIVPISSPWDPSIQVAKLHLQTAHTPTIDLPPV